MRERRHSELIKLVQAMLFQAFSDHFGRLTGFKILQTLNFIIAELQFTLMFLGNLAFFQSAFFFLQFEFPVEPCDFGFLFGKFLVFSLYGSGYSQFFFRVSIAQRR